MKTLFTLLAISLSVLTSAQDTVSQLRVQGTAEVSVKPTQTAVSLTIQSTHKTYAGAVERLINRVDLLAEAFRKINFQEEELITSNFTVNKNRVMQDGTWKDDGFIATQILRVQFDQDKNRLLEVLNTATSSEADPAISLSFELDSENETKLKTELIRLAVQDARSKAEIIATEAGYEIAGIKEINYNTNYPIASQLVNVTNNPNMRIRGTMSSEMSSFEVDNLTFSDNVDIVFIIKPK